MVIRKKLTRKLACWSPESQCVRELPFLGPLRLVSAHGFRSRLGPPLAVIHSLIHEHAWANDYTHLA